MAPLLLEKSNGIIMILNCIILGGIMMVKYSRLLLGAVALILLLLTACSNDENEESKETENQDRANTEEEAEEAENEEDEETEEVSFEVNQNQPPEDQGDTEVRLEGEVQVTNETVSVLGETNLLPEAQLMLLISSEEGVLIGTNDRAQVNEDGTFELESGLPEEVEGFVHIEIKFEPTNQSEEIKSHYVNDLDGSFARTYTESDETYQKASFQQTVSLSEGDQIIKITEPSWDTPDDYGEEAIWIEPAVERQEDYIVVKIDSNLIEETFIQARADIPNYITTGFQGFSYINPDGTAVLYIKDPEKDSRIKELTEYEIVITMDPSHGNNGPHISELYGENGENLAGDLVLAENDTNMIRQTITITADESK